MPVTLKLSVDDSAVQTYLLDLGGRTADLSPVFKRFGAYMLRSVAKNFREGGRPNKWMISRKRVKRPGSQTLIATGILKNSIAPEFDAKSLTISMGSNLKYARIHQLGAPWGRFKRPAYMPARPYLLFQDEDLDYFKNLVNRHLAKVGI